MVLINLRTAPPRQFTLHFISSPPVSDGHRYRTCSIILFIYECIGTCVCVFESREQMLQRVVMYKQCTHIHNEYIFLCIVSHTLQKVNMCLCTHTRFSSKIRILCRTLPVPTYENPSPPGKYNIIHFVYIQQVLANLDIF